MGTEETTAAELAALTIVSPPAKTKYELGEALDLTGLTVRAEYRDGTAEYLDNSVLTVTGYDPNLRGESVVTVAYQDVSATFEVTVAWSSPDGGYRVRLIVDGEAIVLHDLAEQIVLIDPVLELEENTSGSLTFQAPPDNPGWAKLEPMRGEIRVERVTNEAVFRGRIVSVTTDFWKMREVVCEGSLGYLADRQIAPCTFEAASPELLFQSAVAAHNAGASDEHTFTAGAVSVAGETRDVVVEEYTDVLTFVRESLLETVGGYLDLPPGEPLLTIRYRDEDDRDVGSQIIEFGENLLDYAHERDGAPLATVCIPLGAVVTDEDGNESEVTIESLTGGFAYIEDAEAVAKYGRIERVVTWDWVQSPATLLAKAQKWLSQAKSGDLTLTVTAIDLSLLDVSISRLRLSQSVRVVSAPHGIDRLLPVTAMTVHLTEPERDTVTLGVRRETLTEFTRKKDRETAAQARRHGGSSSGGSSSGGGSGGGCSCGDGGGSSGGIKVESVTALPGSPDPDTLYLIQGGVEVL